ncbi:MAG TPA: PadR family transcriptional regulator [Candidatus Limnocylindrales bacterium]
MPTAILALLVEQPMHGYQIIQELATRSGGAWAPGAGSVYTALEQMEVQGLATGEQQDDKRVYSITDKGRELAQHSQRHGHAPRDEAAEASCTRVDLRQSVMSLFQTAEQVGRTGTDEQISKGRRAGRPGAKAGLPDPSPSNRRGSASALVGPIRPYSALFG